MGRAEKRLMADTFEIKGLWFLPGSNMNKDGVEGVLRYSPSEILLELIGAFDKATPFSVEEVPELKIYGFSEFGEWLTLFDCMIRRAEMHAPGFSTETYIVNKFYIGTKCIENENSDLIENAVFSFTNLDAWLDYRMIEIRAAKDTKKMTLTLDPCSPNCSRDKISLTSNNLILNEEIGYGIQYPQDFFLSEKTVITIQRFYRFYHTAGDLLSPLYLLENMQHLRRLLVLLVGSPMYFSYIQLNFPSTKETPHMGQEFERKQYCRVFYTQAGDVLKAKHLAPNRPNSILIKRVDLKENLASIFNYWFEKQDKLSEITSAYISDLYLPTYMENKYLNVVRGIETYHRFFVEGKEDQIFGRDDTEWTRDCDIIISFIDKTVSENNRDFFKERIRYEGEKSFRKRLKELLALVPEKLSVRLWGDMNSNEKNRLISTIIDTRNYYTHRDDRKKYHNVVENHAALNSLTEQLSVLLQFFCLTHIGISNIIVEKRLLERI